MRQRASGRAELPHDAGRDWAGEFAAMGPSAQPWAQQFNAAGVPPHAHVDTPRYAAHHPDGARPPPHVLFVLRWLEFLQPVGSSRHVSSKGGLFFPVRFCFFTGSQTRHVVFMFRHTGSRLAKAQKPRTPLVLLLHERSHRGTRERRSYKVVHERPCIASHFDTSVR